MDKFSIEKVNNSLFISEPLVSADDVFRKSLSTSSEQYVSQANGVHHATSRFRDFYFEPTTRYLTCIFQFDERKGATWHCVVGRNFGSFVTHGMSHESSELSDASESRRYEKKSLI